MKYPLLFILQMAGTAAFAASGALAAGRKSLDLIGVMVVSFAAAAGGGTLRDLLLDRPVFWLADSSYLIISIACGILIWIYTRWWDPPHRLILLMDAVGLSIFVISGVKVAEELKHTALVCVVMGMITGIVGGVIRDILCGEIPMTLRRGELYASATLMGGTVYLALQKLGVPFEVAGLSGIGTIFFLRMAAVKWKWHLPVFEFKEREKR